MIKIEKLTKVYKSKKRSKVKALDDINLILPNTGLVFVLGKSGSGKSTLLNLIGGLDNISSGSIIVDGNNISDFKERNFCDYRNNHIGFIFQDYHLIDELTVYDNIVLSLNLRRIEDKELVSSALKKVDLEGYENRYPTELSGGESQRVAIARALVKKPRIILADEPTGNLDTHTAKAIVEILKELSKDCLILIVSHNVNDANKYADRIIELSKGKIISDKSKNPSYIDNVVYDNNIIYYPYDKALDDNDVNLINANLPLSSKLVVVKDKYIETNLANVERNKVKIEKKSLSILKEFDLSLKFLKNKVFSIFFSGFMVSAIMIILALALTIVTFNSGEIIKDEMNKINQSSLLLEKQMTDEQKINTEASYNVSIDEGDIQKFKDEGYEGNIYEVLSYTVPIASSTNSAGYVYNYYNHGIYINETFGTLIVDEDFMVKKFGKLEYIAKLEEFHPLGVVITDYIADAILDYNKIYGKNNIKFYKDILGPQGYNSFTTKRVIINGIIQTNYSKKYINLVEGFKSGEIKNLKDISDDPLFREYNEEVYDSLGYSFSFNKNFLSDYINNRDIEIAWHYKLVFDKKNQYKTNNSGLPYFLYDSQKKYNLKDNEIVMSVRAYNEIFKTNYNADTLDNFVPHYVNLTQYYFYDYANEKSLFDKDVYIKALTTDITSTAVVSDEIFKEFSKNAIITTGLYLDGIEGVDNVLDLSDKLGYQPVSYVLEGIHTMTKAVDVFIPIFELIAIVLCGGIIFILVNFSTKMIKDKIHDIGILKALGTQNKSIGIVFGIQIILIALATMLMSTVGYYYFIDLANDVLISSLKQLASSHIVVDLKFLTFKFIVVGFNVILIVILSIISLVVPMIKINNIKPVKIIKTKD